MNLPLCMCVCKLVEVASVKQVCCLHICQAWLASNMEEPLVEELLEILSNGHASKIQSLAAATLKTCVAPECIRELAELGSWGPRTKSRKMSNATCTVGQGVSRVTRCSRSRTSSSFGVLAEAI